MRIKLSLCMAFMAIFMIFMVSEARAEDFMAEGNAAFAAQQFEQSYELFDKAVKSDPNNADAYVGRARSLKRLGHYEESMADLNKAISMDSNNFALYLYRGSFYRELGQTDKIEADYKKSLALEPKSIEALMVLVTFYNDNDRCKEAIPYAEEMVKLFESKSYVTIDGQDDGFGAVYLVAATSYLYNEEYEKALAMCNKGKNVAPAPELYYFMYANINSKLKNYKEALAGIDLMMKENTDQNVQTMGYFVRSSTYLDMGEYEKALADINACLKLAPEYADAYSVRADIYEKMGEKAKAEADNKKYLELRNK